MLAASLVRPSVQRSSIRSLTRGIAPARTQCQMERAAGAPSGIGR